MQKHNKRNTTWRYARAANSYSQQSFCSGTAYSGIRTHTPVEPNLTLLNSFTLYFNIRHSAKTASVSAKGVELLPSPSVSLCVCVCVGLESGEQGRSRDGL